MLERMAGEGAKAHAARVAYVTMGPGRSLERVGQSMGHKGASGMITRWAAQWRWADAAATWDAAQADEAQRRAGEAYQLELEAHRRTALATGKALCIAATRMLALLSDKLPTMTLTPAHLGVVARALVTAHDLEAHALGVERLMQRMGEED